MEKREMNEDTKMVVEGWPEPRLHKIPEYAELVRKLAAWCREERGRQSALARELGISTTLVTLWLCYEREIGLVHWLRITAIMKRRRKQRNQ
jgi:hypothetical protein